MHKILATEERKKKKNHLVPSFAFRKFKHLYSLMRVVKFRVIKWIKLLK